MSTSAGNCSDRKFVRLIALIIVSPLIILPAAMLIADGHKSSAQPAALSLTTPPGRIIEIGLANKHYVPPPRTAKIPPELPQASLAVRPGDTLRICNHDTTVYKPFSYSPHNKFGGLAGPRGLRPGACMNYVVKNPTNKTIVLSLFDEIHQFQKIVIAVLAPNADDQGEEDTPNQQPEEERPSHCPGTFAGTWKSSFGTLTLTANNSGEIEGTYDFDGGGLRGRISNDGKVLEGTYTENKAAGRFRFTLNADGSGFTGNWNRTSGTREPPSGTWNGKCAQP